MRTRKYAIGDKNYVGQALCHIRKLKLMKIREVVCLLNRCGLDFNESTLSKIEGRHRAITDKELIVFSKIYNMPISEIYEIARAL